MSFHDIDFPSGAVWGSLSGMEHNVGVYRSDSGADVRVNYWDGPIHHYNIRYALKSYSQIREIYEFCRAREGSTHSFRFKDWLDYSSNPLCRPDNYVAPDNEDQAIGLGDNTTKDFYLVKTYEVGGPNPRIRNILLPIASSVVVALDGVNQASGWSLITSPGQKPIIRFTSAPGFGVQITAGYEFDVHARFGEDASRALEISLDEFGSGSISNDVMIDEIIDPVTVDESHRFGGGTSQAWSSGSLEYSYTMGQCVELVPGASSLEFNLPSVTIYPEGGPHFVLINASANDVDLTSAGMTTVTLGAGEACQVYCIDESGKRWVMLRA